MTSLFLITEHQPDRKKVLVLPGTPKRWFRRLTFCSYCPAQRKARVYDLLLALAPNLLLIPDNWRRVPEVQQGGWPVVNPPSLF